MIKEGLDVDENSFTFNGEILQDGKGELSFFVGYDISILFNIDSIPPATRKLVTKVMGGMRDIDKVRKRESGVGTAKELDAFRKAVKKGIQRATKESIVHGFTRRTTFENVSGSETETDYYSAVLRNEEFTEAIDRGVMDEVANLMGAISIARMIEFSHESLSSEEVVLGVAQVMAEYIESGMKQRLSADGLQESDLYRSISVRPAFMKENRTITQKKGNKPSFWTKKRDVVVGVVIKMKEWGIWVDGGRSPSVGASRGYETLMDSPFYRGLFSWALDHLHIKNTHGMKEMLDAGNKGYVDYEYRSFSSKDTGSSARSWAFEHKGNLPAVAMLEGKKKREMEVLVDTAAEGWIGEVRKTERRILPEGGGRYFKDDKGSLAGRGSEMHHAATRRAAGDFGKAQEMEFEDVVYLLYRRINEVGYEGNQFLSNTLTELRQKGVLEYYFSAYMWDALKEESGHHAESTLTKYKHIWVDENTNKGKVRVETTAKPG